MDNYTFMKSTTKIKIKIYFYTFMKSTTKIKIKIYFYTFMNLQNNLSHSEKKFRFLTFLKMSLFHFFIKDSENVFFLDACD
jgi:hypothetical protein